MTDLFVSLQAVRRRYNLWPPSATLLVAVSGGPDSLCLLHLLYRLAATDGLNLHVAHLNHGLRPAAAADARYVAETAAAWNLPVTIEAYDVTALAQREHQGIEAAARQARYGFFADLAVRIGAHAIALGHTADDQAETVLLRLLRGAGPTGLAAMRPRSVWADGKTLVRPLLHVRRSEILHYCAEHQLQPRYDASNANLRFLRNRVRAELLPGLAAYNPDIVRALGRTAQLCADEDDYLATTLDEQWATFAFVKPACVTLARTRLLDLHPALRRRAVRRAVGLVGTLTEVGADHLDRMLDVIARGHGRLQLPGGRWLAVVNDQVIIEQLT